MTATLPRSVHAWVHEQFQHIRDATNWRVEDTPFDMRSVSWFLTAVGDWAPDCPAELRMDRDGVISARWPVEGGVVGCSFDPNEVLKIFKVTTALTGPERIARVTPRELREWKKKSQHEDKP
jgi:hypothetical protein